MLAAAVRLVARIPDDRTDWTPPGHERALRDLAFQIFRAGLAYADGMDMGRVPATWRQEQAPADLRDGPAIARYGALVRGRLGGWFEGAGAGEYRRTIDVAGVPRSGYELLEQTASNVARQLRQLHSALADLGMAPLDPLPASDLEGLVS